MDITDQIALVTGANRGIGRQFVLELLDRGVEQGLRDGSPPETLDFDDARVVPLRLDLLDHESVARQRRARPMSPCSSTTPASRPAPLSSPATSPRSAARWTRTSGARST